MICLKGTQNNLWILKWKKGRKSYMIVKNGHLSIHVHMRNIIYQTQIQHNITCYRRLLSTICKFSEELFKHF
jgi:hypothetical protein